MPFYRFFPILLAVGGLVVLMGALRRPAHPASRSVDPVPPSFAGLDRAPVDPQASALVNQAVVRLEEPRVGWLEAGVWLRDRLPELAFTAEGVYVRAPGRRFRLELQTHLEDLQPSRDGQASGCTVLSVSDGPNLWTANRTRAGEWTNVTRLRTAAILDGPESPTTLPQVRNEFLAWQAMRGVELLLRSMNGHLDWVRRDDLRGEVELIARWKPWVVSALVPGKQPWPGALPRYCRLRLRGADLWPARIEWWGPLLDNGPDRLLFELEFRDPIFGRPIADDRCARLFAFDPGKAAVEDTTPRIRDTLANRVKELTPAR